MSKARQWSRRGAVLAGLCSVWGCSESPTDAEEPGVTTLAVDASTDWAFVRLGEAANAVEVADPRSSAEWDLGLFATAVMLNGGDAGPGGVEGFCVCQNAAAGDAQVTAMTADDELAAFEAVGPADVPADEASWQGDALVPVLDGWYTYDPQTHVVAAAPTAVWKLRTGDGAAFAKLHVTDVQDPTMSTAGVVTLEFAVQPAVGAAFGPVRTLEVDLRSGSRVAVDLQTAAVTEDGWDIALEGYTIRLNGGASGAGQAGAVIVPDAFDDIDDASDMAGLYRADAFGGAFASDEPGRQWYRYNLDGQHQIWPTYNVYLVRRGGAVYKVQLIGYYDEAGAARHVTFRYARLGT